MRIFSIGLIVIGVLLSAVGQLLLKVAMSSATMQVAIRQGSGQLLLTMLQSYWLIAGLICYGLSVLVWLAVLSAVDVSYAYPFVALGMVVTTLFGHFLLGEELPPLRLGGMAVIFVGVLLVAKSYPHRLS